MNTESIMRLDQSGRAVDLSQPGRARPSGPAAGLFQRVSGQPTARLISKRGSRSRAIEAADTSFAPIFVVGCQRSGTTALAVMLDRHSRIAMLPETQFFNKFIHKDRAAGGEMSHRAMAERALVCPFIEETHLSLEELLAVFETYEPTYPNLFRSLMEAYQIHHGKVRAAEKTCNHLFHISELLRLYPQSKFICIVRDGRDVCRSIRNVPWGAHATWESLCRQWKGFAREGMRLQRKLSPKIFTIVRYEDLMREPERELRRLCEFIGEEFEPAQLEEGTGTDVIPVYEQAWKGKARKKPDAQRVEAWRRNETPLQIAQWNFYMGRTLRACGYPDTRVEGVPLSRRLIWAAKYVPYLPGLHPIALWANRLLRGRNRLFEKVTAEAKQRAGSQSDAARAEAKTLQPKEVSTDAGLRELSRV